MTSHDIGELRQRFERTLEMETGDFFQNHDHPIVAALLADVVDWMATA